MYNSLRIGYVPYSNDLQHPDDRRRFPFFANRAQISYEIANKNGIYDIILLPASANLTRWLEYKKNNPKTIFIFEMVDSLTYQRDWKNLLFKGAGRFIMGKEDSPTLIHKNLLVQWIKIADYVICSNPKVQSELVKWNKRVLLNLDYTEHEYPIVKEDYSIRGKMKLFWEGQGVVLPQLLSFKNVFKEVSSFCELHIVTAPYYPRFGYFFKKSAVSLLKELPIDSYFHIWNLKTNSALYSGFDCGIIPISAKDIYAWHKPANKLISFWFSGIPTLTSNKPAYTDLSEGNPGNFLCSTENEWIEKIGWIYNLRVDERRTMASWNYAFAKANFSNEIQDRFWFDLIEKISKKPVSSNKLIAAA